MLAYISEKSRTALAYETPKLVRIRDRKLGTLYLSLCALALTWVVGFQILYGNEHFQLFDVQGTARMTIQQPTRGCNPNDADCFDDFASVKDLAYCEQSGTSGGGVSASEKALSKKTSAAGVVSEQEEELPPPPQEEEQGSSDEEEALLQTPTAIKKKILKRRCIYADQHELAPQGMLEDTMFIPTRIDTHLETRACGEPSAANNWGCEKAYEMSKMEENIYVADIENYTLLLTHTYHRGAIAGNNLFHQGQFEVCVGLQPGDSSSSEEENASGKGGAGKGEVFLPLEPCAPGVGRKEVRKIACIKPGICHFDDDNSSATTAGKDSAEGDSKKSAEEKGPSFLDRRTSQHTALTLSSESSEFRESQQRTSEKPPPYFAIPAGDVFKLSHILKLAGIDLDRTFNTKHEPRRESGTIIEIEVVYNNLHAWTSTWGNKDIGYTYKVVERPIEEMKTEMYSADQPADFPKTRKIENRHGLYVRVKVGGTFGFFNVVYLLVMLTTSLTLLAGATKVTDLVALYVLEKRRAYYDMKYQVADGS
eukprot:gene407-92_t